MLKAELHQKKAQTKLCSLCSVVNQHTQSAENQGHWSI